MGKVWESEGSELNFFSLFLGGGGGYTDVDRGNINLQIKEKLL